MNFEANRRSQAELYGEPLSEVVGGICSSLGVNQSTVARVLGLSAPMLSHLVAARRVKVSNPLAHSRLIRLRELAAAVVGGSVTAPAAVEELERIAESQDSWATSRTDGGLEVRLKQAASPGEWRQIVELVRDQHPRVAGVLEELTAE